MMPQWPRGVFALFVVNEKVVLLFCMVWPNGAN